MQEAGGQQASGTEYVASTVKTMPAQFELLATSVFINLICPWKTNSLYCEFFDTPQLLEDESQSEPKQQEKSEPKAQEDAKEIPKIQVKQSQLKKDENYKQKWLNIYNSAIKKKFHNYFVETGFYKPQKQQEQFFRFIISCYSHDEAKTQEKFQKVTKAEKAFQTVKQLEDQGKPKEVKQIINDLSKKFVEFLKSTYARMDKLWTEQTKVKLEEQLKNGGQPDFLKKIAKHMRDVKERMKTDQEWKEKINSMPDVLLYTFLIKNYITPDFVFSLNDAFTLDFLLLGEHNSSLKKAIKLIEPSQISKIHKISKFHRKYAFVGQITTNSLDLTNKVLQLDRYLFFATDYYGKDYTIFGVIIVNGLDNPKLIRLTLSMIPQNTRIGQAYKDNRLIVLKIGNDQATFYSMLQQVQQKVFMTYSFTFLSQKRPSLTSDQYQKGEKAILDIIDKNFYSTENFKLGKIVAFEKLKEGFTDEKQESFDGFNAPLYKQFPAKDLINGTDLQLKDKLPIIQQFQRDLIVEEVKKQDWEEEVSPLGHKKLQKIQIGTKGHQIQLMKLYKTFPTFQKKKPEKP